MEMEIINVLVSIVAVIIVVGIMITIVCIVGIHKCNKTISECDDEIERINRELFVNNLDRAQLGEEINNLKTVIDFIDKWRGHGLVELTGENYNHPIWKEYNKYNEDIQEMISKALRMNSVIKYMKEDEM